MRFICVNDTFDEQGRVLIQNAVKPHCEELKLDLHFIEKYKLMQQSYSMMTYKPVNTEFATRFRTGYTIDTFGDCQHAHDCEHGIQWCKDNPRSKCLA